MLLARRGLDGRDDLARDAQLGEGTEARLMLGTEVARRLVETDQRFLLDVVGITTDQEVATALRASESPVAGDQRFEGEAIACLEPTSKFVVCEVGEWCGSHACLLLLLTGECESTWER